MGLVALGYVVQVLFLLWRQLILPAILKVLLLGLPVHVIHAPAFIKLFITILAQFIGISLILRLI